MHLCTNRICMFERSKCSTCCEGCLTNCVEICQYQMENDLSPENAPEGTGETVGGTSEASGDVAPNLPAAESDKIDILLKATGDAPILKRRKWSVPGDRKISSIIEFLKKYLKCKPHESLFLYVQQTFAPSPDQDIRNLYECYGSDGKLVLHYCKSEAWG